MIAVYIIRNILNNKSYIGSSQNVELRWKEHLNDLKKNKHHSIKLQRAWNKYGEENFIFEILEICNENNIFDIEQVLIDKFNVYRNGYNCSLVSRNPVFIREDGSSNAKKSVLQLDMNNNVLEEYPSLRAASSDFNKSSSSNIMRCCKGEVKQHKGYKWKYKDDRSFDEKWNNKQNEDSKEKWKKSNIGLKKPKQSETMKKLHATGLYNFGRNKK